MKYMLLIYAPPEARPATPEEMAERMPMWNAYTDELKQRKAYIDGKPLADTSSATTVRAHNGKRTITDGPFAETKEFLGGFYMIETPTLDEAIELAGKCPAAKYGSIEVRPIVEM